MSKLSENIYELIDLFIFSLYDITIFYLGFSIINWNFDIREWNKITIFIFDSICTLSTAHIISFIFITILKHIKKQ